MVMRTTNITAATKGLEPHVAVRPSSSRSVIPAL
jgi:hypothetical protein